MPKSLLAALAAVAVALPASAETFSIDSAHSSVGFRVRHLVGKVRGHFDKFEGTVEYEEGSPATWKANAAIEPASINTANDKRDGHLRTPDFFNVEKCPKLEFASRKVVANGGKLKLIGDLTLHCVTKPVALDLEINGIQSDPQGNRHLGATANGKLNRKDYGMVWNKALDKGGLMLGEDVELEIEVEAVAKAAPPASDKK